jgi:PST family polysaccharide transporter
MAFVNVVFKVSAAVSIFFIIRAESDFLWVNFILGLGNSLASVALILYIFLKLKVQFILPTMSDLLDGLRPGWDIFLANFYISLYNNSNILILSLFVSNEIVGIYSVIDKVINVFRQIIGVLLQSVYPTACKLAEESVTSVVQFLKPLWRRLSFGVLAISFLIMFYSKEILTFVIGNENALAEAYLTILAIIPIVVFYSTYFVAVILSYNNTSVYKKIFMYAAILNILTNLVLAYFFKIKGTIITVFVSEIFILVVTMSVYKKLF